MNSAEQKFIQQKVEEICGDAGDLYHLMNILEELIVNETDNLTGCDICTLIVVIVKFSKELSNKVIDFKKELGI